MEIALDAAGGLIITLKPSEDPREKKLPGLGATLE